MFRYLPSADSEFAPVVDNITNLVTDLSVFFTVAIVGTMIYFAVKYRKKGEQDHETPHIEGSLFLEVLWTVVPTIICVLVALYGYYGYQQMRTVPEGALEINVLGKKWDWVFTYANGKETIGEFTVPVNTPIKLVLTSQDVLHSFFVPGMRTKMDAIPGRYTYQWFKPVKTGPQQVYCTEYCGDQHSRMLAKMNVVPEAEYSRWLEQREATGDTPAEKGQYLYQTKGCKSCHSIDGSRVVGPSFLKLYGRKGLLADSTSYEADENYIKESILYPNTKVVQGYPSGVMQAYEGLLSDEEIGHIIAYIKTLDGSAVVESEPEVQETVTLSTEEQLLEDLKSKLPIVATCAGCHNVTGAPGGVGPTWKGLYGRKGKFADGSEYVADEAYIKESIWEPGKHIVEGYEGRNMPAYAGQIDETQMQQIIDVIKQLK